MKTRICGMSLGEIERKFARFDLVKREREAADRMGGIEMVPMPDRTPRKAVKLASKILPEVLTAKGEAYARAKDLLPIDGEWKKAMRLYARLERLDEICVETIVIDSHPRY